VNGVLKDFLHKETNNNFEINLLYLNEQKYEAIKQGTDVLFY
jgi:hypothetical protein